MTAQLPSQAQAFIDARVPGHPHPAYRRWMVQVTELVNSIGTESTPAPAPEPVSFVINGSGSVTADGSVAGGEFVVGLANDRDVPMANHVYGTSLTGEKGWIPVYDTLTAGTGIAITDSGYTIVDTVSTPDDLPLTGNDGEAVRVTESEPGIYAWDGSAFTIDTDASGEVEVALADLEDTEVGTALVKITRDAKGRVEGTEAADTDDLTEGATNLYFTNQRAYDTVKAILQAGANITITPNDGSKTLTLSASGGGGSGGDPFIGSLASLLHLDGADTSTTFTDVRGKTWTGAGNAQLDTAQSKFGSASLLLDGSGDYISASHADLDLTQEQFWSIEGFIRPASLSSTQGLFFNGNLASNTSRIQLYLNDSGNLVGLVQSSTDTITNAVSSTALSAATWYHVAMVRSGSIVRIFINGVLEGSFTVSGSVGASNFAAIGNGRSGGGQVTFNGHIDEFRITKGQSRYTVNFDVPTAAFPDS